MCCEIKNGLAYSGSSTEGFIISVSEREMQEALIVHRGLASYGAFKMEMGEKSVWEKKKKKK